ncbi:IS110 family transposase [Falsarthrobacter nasiphocae]|uniref:Transposase n=1 Tax=Falsarthrobacter nasiphocae TaxID=189863 RepID=A0AAE3YHY0_9MICC|nr:IS110 family transposase [Falsarthrobacter nasiphocae]MDR6892081.1 transposase [Falsarthrobacter nasiphocae]
MTYQLYIGLDVGKGEHHATALLPDGTIVHDKPLAQSEPKLRDLFTDLIAQHGTGLVVVDQPKTIGALPVAVAKDVGLDVAYLPGLTMRRVADLHPGQAKTDARDAFIIADTARTMPHTLRSITVTEENIAELTMLCGFDDDLAAQTTQVSNRLRGLLTQIHPALERVIGPHLDHKAVVDLLTRYPSPGALKTAGRGHVRARLRKLAPRLAPRLTEEIFEALAEQTVVVAGTGAAAKVIGRLAEQLVQLRRQRDDIAEEILAVVDAHPLSPVLMSMPGVGVRTAARLLTEVVGKTFKSAAHLASYAGIAPVTRQSGSSIRGESASRRGNKILKRALFLSAFAALSDPASRAYYDRKRAQGKRHNQAVMALARRRSDVLFAMLRDGTFYESRPPRMALVA